MNYLIDILNQLEERKEELEMILEYYSTPETIQYDQGKYSEIRKVIYDIKALIKSIEKNNG